MINLIPTAAKKKVRTEYWVRVASVWMMLWSLALFAAASILLPAYVLVSSQVTTYQASAAEASQKVASYENVSVSLVKASQSAKVVVDEERLSHFSQYVKLLESLQGEKVQVTSLNVSRSEKGINPLTVGGIARDRQALASFRDRLLADESVTSVDLPISNLARDKDIVFTLTVTLANANSI